MRVAVVGCGYVGLALGRRLRDAGHGVVGVRRSAEGLSAVEEAGLDAVRADATDPGSLSRIPDADAVVYAASAGGRGAEAARETYVEGLRAVAREFAGRAGPPDRLLYTSSTGVYGDHGGAWVDESTPIEPESERERVLADAEAVAREAEIDATVVRLAGLYGPGRYRLDRYLEGPVAEGWLNLLHRDDAAGVLAFLLRRGLAHGGTVLAVDDEPVRRPELAAWLARQCGVDPPAVQPLSERLAGVDSGARRRRIAAQKRCSNARLRELGYEFAYPTYREGYREAVG